MENKIRIKINGETKNVADVSYDTHSIDSKKERGSKNYNLEIDLSYFEEQIKPLYESNLKSLKEAQFIKREISFYEWVAQDKLLKKVCLDWFGYAILDPFLKYSNYPKFLVKSIDDIEKKGGKIIIYGTISDKTF